MLVTSESNIEALYSEEPVLLTYSRSERAMPYEKLKRRRFFIYEFVFVLLAAAWQCCSPGMRFAGIVNN
jgi:hypothetical protein